MISVIIPVYKVEKYLDECVQSIVNQSYANLEIILVDDGSPDSCGAMCDEWAKKDSRIRVIHKPNGGLSSARNAGLDIAKGDYIGFVDSDDFVALDWYETLHSAIIRTDADIVKAGLIYFSDPKDGNLFNPDTDIYKIASFEKEEAFPSEQLLLRMAGHDHYVTSHNMLAKADVYKTLRFPVGVNGEDYRLCFSLPNHCQTIAVIPYSGLYYRLRAGSITSTGDTNFIHNHIINLSLHSDVLVERFNEHNEASALVIKALESFFFHVVPADKIYNINLPQTAATWKILSSACKKHDIKKLVSPILYWQYRFFDVDPKIYKLIISLKKAISKK